MTLAFSTLGCPDWDFEQILRAATRWGYGAIEWRGYRETMDLTQAAPFLPESLAQTRQRLGDAGVSVCCLGSSGVLAEGNLDHVRAHAALAARLGCPYVRIFGGTPESEAQAVEMARKMADAAMSEGAALVLETHDAFSTGQAVGALVERAAHPALFSLWDMHHPWRQGEAPQDTHAALAPTLRHIHIKDGTAAGYALPGEGGDVPLSKMLALARSGGYDGAVSLEWEKRWHPELAPPEIAFPAYAEAMRRWLQPE